MKEVKVDGRTFIFAHGVKKNWKTGKKLRLWELKNGKLIKKVI
jgi:hypothetical protein